MLFTRQGRLLRERSTDVRARGPASAPQTGTLGIRQGKSSSACGIFLSVNRWGSECNIIIYVSYNRPPSPHGFVDRSRPGDTNSGRLGIDVAIHQTRIMRNILHDSRQKLVRKLQHIIRFRITYDRSRIEKKSHCCRSLPCPLYVDCAGDIAEVV